MEPIDWNLEGPENNENNDDKSMPIEDFGEENFD